MLATQNPHVRGTFPCRSRTGSVHAALASLSVRGRRGGGRRALRRCPGPPAIDSFEIGDRSCAYGHARAQASAGTPRALVAYLLRLAAATRQNASITLAVQAGGSRAHRARGRRLLVCDFVTPDDVRQWRKRYCARSCCRLRQNARLPELKASWPAARAGPGSALSAPQ